MMRQPGPVKHDGTVGMMRQPGPVKHDEPLRLRHELWPECPLDIQLHEMRLIAHVWKAPCDARRPRTPSPEERPACPLRTGVVG